MCTQQSGNTVRREDSVQGRSVFWICLKHLLDQILQLIRQMFWQGRVCTPTHLKNQTLPAACLKLNTRTRCET